MSKSWHTPRVGPKTNVRPSGPHKQKNRTPWDDWDEEDTLMHQIDAIDEYALAEEFWAEETPIYPLAYTLNPQNKSTDGAN